MNKTGWFMVGCFVGILLTSIAQERKRPIITRRKVVRPPASRTEAGIGTLVGKTVAMREVWKITAYCPCKKCCGRWSDGVTASGHKIQSGDRFVAADKSIPFGMMITIPGYGTVPVLDRGGAIKGNRIDVYFDTHQEALEWGVQYFERIE